MYYSFSFRSRNCAIRFYDSVRNEGIPAQIINSPRAGGSCALGVKIAEAYLARARRVLDYYTFPSFIEIYPLENG